MLAFVFKTRLCTFHMLQSVCQPFYCGDGDFLLICVYLLVIVGLCPSNEGLHCSLLAIFSNTRPDILHTSC